MATRDVACGVSIVAEKAQDLGRVEKANAGEYRQPEIVDLGSLELVQGYDYAGHYDTYEGFRR